MRFAGEHDILYAVLFAELALILVATILVHNKDVWLQGLNSGHKIHHAAARIDKGILNITDALYHEQAFLLAVDGFVVLVAEDGGVGTDADIEVAIFRRLAEKFHMAAVQKVVAAADEDFFLCAHTANLHIWREFHKMEVLRLSKRWLPLHPCSKTEPGLCRRNYGYAHY